MPQPMSVPPTMYWQQTGSKIIDYYNGVPLSAKFGDFHTTAHFSNNNYTIISNATLSHVKLLHNGITVKCYSPLSTSSKIITVAGIYLMKLLQPTFKIILLSHILVTCISYIHSFRCRHFSNKHYSQ